MKKAIQMIVLSMILFTTISIIIPIKAEASTASTLVVHYKRFDSAEFNYGLWLWPNGGDGANYAFTSTDDYGAVATIDLDATNLNSVTSVGVLVYKSVDGTWIKDIDQDRYIDISNPNALGEVHAYILTGVNFISYVSESLPGCDVSDPDPNLCAQVITEGLIDVYFDETYHINFSVTSSVEASNIQILKNGTPITFSGFTSGQTGTLTLSETVNMANTYTFVLDWNGVHNEQVIRLNADYDSEAFQEMYNYDGELGAIYLPTSTTFKVWAPLSAKVEVNLYTAGHTTAVREDGANMPYAVYDMNYDAQGVWYVTITEDLQGVYYTFNVLNDGVWVTDIQDPYGKTFGLNGQRAMVVNFEDIDPFEWETDQSVEGYTNPNNAIIYELHVRDLTSQAAEWGGPIEYSGKYLGISVLGTSYTNPYTNITVTTGLSHLVELGITHLHLLPTYDQDWNNEADMVFNWGYNPQNYNSPEGGYSTDPYDGSVRVTEYKEMVMALHENGINVIQDVVYNHTGPGAYYSFNRIVPEYIYRIYDGVWSNGTGVGNETASERFMWSKFMVDSVVYWAEEYHIDGFRFDLMAVHDYLTMNRLADALETIDSNIFVYGEPWGGGAIALDYNLQAGKNNLDNMPLISAFNDSFRNAIKGSPDGSDGGYVTTGLGIYDIMKGLKGSITWDMGLTSSQSINYVTAHDNLTLYDKLKIVNNSTVYTEAIDYQARLANSIVLLSQGVPFLHAGVDFLRTKGGDSNSYQSSDAVNQLNWVRKSNNVASFEYYKGIIEIRKAFDSFKMVTEADINSNITFLYPDGYGLIGMHLTKNGEDIYVYFNSQASENEIVLPEGAWKLIANRDAANLDGLATYAGTYPISKAETLIFIPGNPEEVIDTPIRTPEITNAISAMYEGRDFTVTSSSDIYSYNLDGGDFISVTPTRSINLGALSVGTHTVIIKNSGGIASAPFTITILPLSTAPVITNTDSEIYEGIVLTITSLTDIYSYQIDDGDFESVTPSKSIQINELSVGTHTIVIKNSSGIESDPYTITILEVTIPVITNTVSEINEGEEFILYVNEEVVSYSLNGSEFIGISSANELYFDTLTEGTYTFKVKDIDGNESTQFTLIVNQVVEEVPATGCTWFNAVSLVSFTLVSVLAFVVIRKKV